MAVMMVVVMIMIFMIILVTMINSSISCESFSIEFGCGLVVERNVLQVGPFPFSSLIFYNFHFHSTLFNMKSLKHANFYVPFLFYCNNDMAIPSEEWVKIKKKILYFAGKIRWQFDTC